MKKILTSFFVITLFINHAFAQRHHDNLYTDATKYNNYIVDRQKAVIKSIKDMADEISVDRSVALIMLKTTGKMAMRVADEIANLPACNGNTEFRNKAIAMFRFYGTSYYDQFKYIIVTGGNTKLSGRERETLHQKGVDLDKEEADINTLFKEAQRRFANENNLRLE
jgi:hypothetical protein